MFGYRWSQHQLKWALECFPINRANKGPICQGPPRAEDDFGNTFLQTSEPHLERRSKTVENLLIWNWNEGLISTLLQKVFDLHVRGECHHPLWYDVMAKKGSFFVSQETWRASHQIGNPLLLLGVHTKKKGEARVWYPVYHFFACQFSFKRQSIISLLRQQQHPSLDWDGDSGPSSTVSLQEPRKPLTRKKATLFSLLVSSHCSIEP